MKHDLGLLMRDREVPLDLDCHGFKMKSEQKKLGFSEVDVKLMSVDHDYFVTKNFTRGWTVSTQIEDDQHDDVESIRNDEP